MRRSRLVDPTEEALIRAIADGDGDARMIYADWLEARGWLDRAEFLRTRHRLAALHDDIGTQEAVNLGRLAVRLSRRWRKRLGWLEPIIENQPGIAEAIKTPYPFKLGTPLRDALQRALEET